MRTLADELSGAAPPTPAQNGKRVSPLGPGQPAAPTTTDKPKESDMPKGVYPRKTKNAGAPAGTHAPKLALKAAKKKAAKKTAAAQRTKSRFGVYSDGSVHVDAASCKGILEPGEVDELVDFVQRLRKGAK